LSRGESLRWEKSSSHAISTRCADSCKLDLRDKGRVKYEPRRGGNIPYDTKEIVRMYGGPTRGENLEWCSCKGGRRGKGISVSSQKDTTHTRKIRERKIKSPKMDSSQKKQKRSQI